MPWNAEQFLRMYDDLRSGNFVGPRGQPVKECEDYVLKLDMTESPCTSFAARKFNLDYAKAETWWYLRGNKFDDYIEKRSSMWPKLKQPGGYYHSNYGQYLFDSQVPGVQWAINQLIADKDSRRASIVLLRPEHLYESNTDVVCTYSMNFRIRNDRLNMSVNMRSNDAIFGTTNDVFAFSMVYKIVLGALQHTRYPELEPGWYVHKVDSLHVYERHFKMIDQIVADGLSEYRPIEVPWIRSFSEAHFLLGLHMDKDQRVPQEFEFARWLRDHL